MAENNENQENPNKDENPDEEQLNFVSRSRILQTVVHGMSEMINTRLTREELDLCLELLELGVHPKALADVVNYILEKKGNPTTRAVSN